MEEQYTEENKRRINAQSNVLSADTDKTGAWVK